MNKENILPKIAPWFLTTALFVSSCTADQARAKGSEIDESKSKISDYTPTPTETPTQINTPYLLNMTLSKEADPTPVIPEIPIADSCILPFEDADIDLGLQFLTIFENEGNGKVHRHLGLDFKGGYEGQDVLNMCDGIIIFSGRVKQGEGNNLGNIAVIKYSYFEEGNITNIYMRYAHMENLTQLVPGEIILKGAKLGEIGHSGGWRADQNHLHIDALKEDAFETIVVERSNGNLQNEIGFYAPAELWSPGMISSKFIDVKKWLLERLNK